MQNDKKKPLFPARLKTRFFNAIAQDEIDELRDLIDKNPGKIDMKARTGEGHTPLLLAVDHMAGPEMITFLVNNGADIEARDRLGRTPLLLAIDKCSCSATETLLSLKANVNATDREGNNAFHYLVGDGGSRFGSFLDEELAGLLLKSGGDINRANKAGDTALHLAARGADEDMLKTILACTPDVNVRNKRGETPLHLAVDANTESGAERLIRAGADINARNNELQTPLHLAVQMNYEEAAFSLLDRGANPNIPDANGETPLHLAATESTPDLVVRLLKSGADPLTPSLEGFTALDIARTAGDSGILASTAVQEALTEAVQKIENERLRQEREKLAQERHKSNLEKISALESPRREKPRP